MRLLIGIAMLALVAAPASAYMLTNGSFESGLTGWTNNTNWGTDGAFPNPGSASDGSHWASISNGGNSSFVHTLSQSVPYTGPVSLAVDINLGGASGVSDLIIRLKDGGSTIDSVTHHWPPDLPAWTTQNLSGTASSGTVTVEIEYNFPAQGWGQTGVNVDNAILTPEPAGLALMLLAGVPLLRRRR